MIKSIKNSLWLPAALAILLFFGLAIGISFSQKEEIIAGAGDKAFKDSILKYDVKGNIVEFYKLTNREVLASSFGQKDGKDIVEDISLRTNNIQTAIIGTDKNGNVKKISKINSKGLAQEISTGKWFDVDYTTTTVSDFTQKMSTTWKEKIRENLANTVWAVSTSTYSGDAAQTSLVGIDTVSTWAAARDGTVGNYTINNDMPYIGSYKSGSYYGVYRAAVNFDTSGLPDSITISSSSIYLKFYTAGNLDQDGYDYMRIVDEAAPASETSISQGDFDIFGVTAYSADKSLTPLTGQIGVYFNWPLNATGRAEINTTGNSHFGAREGHDIDNHAPVGIIRFDTHGKSAAFTDQPYLEIEYTEPSTAVNYSNPADTQIFEE